MKYLLTGLASCVLVVSFFLGRSTYAIRVLNVQMDCITQHKYNQDLHDLFKNNVDSLVKSKMIIHAELFECQNKVLFGETE